MNITPRKDIKNLREYMQVPKAPDVKKGTSENKSTDLLTEACIYHKIEQRYVESVKRLTDKCILISFRAPVSRKIRYERQD